jgi:tetratricopeptide (TPR) repeat protein
MHNHFESVPMIKNWHEVNSLEDLTPAIELYDTLIGMGRYYDAAVVFRDQLNDATLYRLSANRLRVELLEMLFPDGLEELPRLKDPAPQAYIISTLATGYDFSGLPGRAVLIYSRHNTIRSDKEDEKNLSIGLCNLSDTLRMTGGLRKSEDAARRALKIARGLNEFFHQAASLDYLGRTLSARGAMEESKSALQRALRMFGKLGSLAAKGVVNSYLAEREIWMGKYGESAAFADSAWDLARAVRSEKDFIRAARVQGEAALGLNDLEIVDERLHHALTRARAVNLVQEELPALIALAELGRRQGDEKAAREFLDDVWEFAERGPYPLLHADALNVLAQIERDAGNTEKAIEAATRAYQISWCDGPPYAYYWGLEKAKGHLTDLKAPFPDMPAFDESKFELMPEVEIDPGDEFHVGESS